MSGHRTRGFKLFIFSVGALRVVRAGHGQDGKDAAWVKFVACGENFRGNAEFN